GEGALVHLPRHLVLLGDRIAHQHARPEAQLTVGTYGGGEIVDAVEALVHRQAGVAAVEGGEAVGPHAVDGDAERLQGLDGPGKGEDRLGSRADDGEGEAGQGGRVRGPVARLVHVAVHASDAA